MTEPDVVITDYLVAAESALFAWLLWRLSSIEPSVRDPFIVFFLATAVGSLAGGTVHGFFLSDASFVGVALWRGAASTILAASIQQFRVALHPRYFNHNALYHVVQALRPSPTTTSVLMVSDSSHGVCAATG